MAANDASRDTVDESTDSTGRSTVLPGEPWPAGLMTMIDDTEFRRVLGHFATGVTVATTRDRRGTPCGLTVNSFCSVSLRPPLVLICVETDADSHDCIRDAGIFAVNVLGEDRGESLSRRFSSWGIEDKLEGIAYLEESTGAPVLEQALAWVDCRVTAEFPGGDHTIFLGEVVAADAREGTPLLYYRGGYGRFVP
jgi:flavin reductase (DIM6/NTAB) family NADH-FMN oxidoreductase RutF